MSIIYMNNKANNSYYCFGDDILEEAQDESLGQCDALKPVDTFTWWYGCDSWYFRCEAKTDDKPTSKALAHT